MIELLKRTLSRLNDFFGFVPNEDDQDVLDALDFEPEEES